MDQGQVLVLPPDYLVNHSEIRDCRLGERASEQATTGRDRTGQRGEEGQIAAGLLWIYLYYTTITASTRRFILSPSCRVTFAVQHHHHHFLTTNTVSNRGSPHLITHLHPPIYHHTQIHDIEDNTHIASTGQPRFTRRTSPSLLHRLRECPYPRSSPIQVHRIASQHQQQSGKGRWCMPRWVAFHPTCITTIPY